MPAITASADEARAGNTAAVSYASLMEQVGKPRIVPRYQFEVRFKIHVERCGETLVTEGWARDLGESGIGAFVAAHLLVGEHATLRIPLPDGSELVIPAKVKRNLGTQYGFQFTALSPEQRNQILRAVEGSKPVPFNPTSL